MAPDTPVNFDALLGDLILDSNGNNYLEWLRVLDNNLHMIKKEYLIQAELPTPPMVNASEEEKIVYASLKADYDAVDKWCCRTWTIVSCKTLKTPYPTPTAIILGKEKVKMAINIEY